jgi:hypothetical protein
MAAMDIIVGIILIALIVGVAFGAYRTRNKLK